MASRKCAGITAKGNACSFSASYGDYCVAHAASNGNEAASVELRRRSHTGANKSIAAAESSKLSAPPSLRTTDAQLVVLERMLMRVENSGADVIAKSGAVKGLVAEARALLKDCAEGENAALRATIERLQPGALKNARPGPLAAVK